MATGSTTAVLEEYALRPELSAPRRFGRGLFRFIRHKPLGAVGGFIVLILLAMAFVPAAFTTQDPNPSPPPLAQRYESMSASHWAGTDNFGRDMYTRLVYGARTSIIIGFGVVFISSILAATLGIVSGYFGGWADMLVQRLVDIGIALPGLIFIILVVTTLQNIPVTLRIIMPVGVLVALGSSRVVRGAAISTKQNQYVEAARVVGATDARIIVRHILPNVLAVVIVGASIQIGGAILIEASLSFLGYGIPPPTPSWGRMLNDSRQQLSNYPHLVVFPTLAIFLAVYSFNMLGDAVRDVLDPRLRGSR
jgi:peptide/nickel transport system permease protein